MSKILSYSNFSNLQVSDSDKSSFYKSANTFSPPSQLGHGLWFLTSQTHLHPMPLLSPEETIKHKLQHLAIEMISAILQNPWVIDGASPSSLCASLSASDMAAEQGQILVIATAAVGGFTLLVILTLFFLITGR